MSSELERRKEQPAEQAAPPASPESDRTPNTDAEKQVEVPAQGATPEETRSKGKTVVIMSALCLAVFLAALDMTIVATALPSISQDFHLSEASYSWIGSAYTLAAAASAPSWGKLSDIWGRKPMMMAANVLFFVGSLVSGLAHNAHALIAGRAIQGLGGGGLLILVNICISDLFSMRNRGKYFGMIGMVWAAASAMGPIIGGALTERVTWRWCFLVNLPTIGVSVLVLFIFLDIHTPKTPLVAGFKAIDWFGTLLIIGGTTMILLALQFGGINFPWNSATVICLLVFGALTIVMFFVVEWKFAEWPVIPIRIFKRPSNLAALGVCFCHGFVFISGTYFLPLYFQAVLGKSPILSGVYLFPFILALSFTSGATGVYIKKTGRYLELIWLGITLETLGFGLFIDIPAQISWPRIIIYQIIAGVGVGTNFQSPLIALQTLVAPRDIATATSTFQFVRQLATSISITIGSVVFQNQMAKKRPYLVSVLGEQVGSTLSDGSAGANIGVVNSLSASGKLIAQQAYTSSLKTMWIVYVCFGALGMVISLFITRQTLDKTHVIQKTGLQAHQEAREAEKREASLSAAPTVAEDEGVKDVEKVN